MNATDITERQLHTLVLVRSLEEFITDEYENLNCLGNVIFTFMENVSYDEHINFIEDICKLTETGYLVSNASKEDIEMVTVPEVEGITPKGKTLLMEFEQETAKKVASGVKVVLFENLFNIDISLLGGIEFGGLFKKIGKMLMKQ